MDREKFPGEGANQGQGRVYTAEYLRVIQNIPAAIEYKAESFRLLEPSTGNRILDAGCGNGEDANRLREIVGDQGLVIGVDGDKALIDQSAMNFGKFNNLKFVQGDLETLPFTESSFDGARSDRVFQHLERPEESLRELARVVKSSGRIVLSDPNWAELEFGELEDADVTAMVRGVCVSRAKNPSLAGEYVDMFDRTGLVDVREIKMPRIIGDKDQIKGIWRIEDALNSLLDDGRLSEERKNAWLDNLDVKADEGSFSASMPIYIVSGVKP
jgi:ubiquinone/menaquinone biosynthesis C-methylase UbiE